MTLKILSSDFFSLAAQHGHNLAACLQWLKIDYVSCRKIKSGSKKFIDLLTAPN